MIKGTLLVSLPIVKRFSVEKVYFLISFSDPLEKPLDGYPWNLRTTPSQWGPLFCHIWRQSNFGRFKDYSLNKKIKKIKNTCKIEQPSVPAYAGTGGCNKPKFIAKPAYRSSGILLLSENVQRHRIMYTRIEREPLVKLIAFCLFSYERWAKS